MEQQFSTLITSDLFNEDDKAEKMFPEKQFFDLSRREKTCLSLKKSLEEIGYHNLFPLFKGLLQDVPSDWEVCLSQSCQSLYEIDFEDKKLSVDQNNYPGDIVISMVEGLRMIRHMEWLEDSWEKYSPETVLRIGRICHADCTVHAVILAWQAKQFGYSCLWRSLLSGESSDLAQFFEEKCKYSGSDEGEATQAIFKRWFADSQRITKCDHEILNMVDSMLADFVRLGTKTLEEKTAACLTLRAGETISYINHETIKDIVRSSDYISIEDPINQTHLMQVIHDAKSSYVGNIAFSNEVLAGRFINIQ